MEIAILRRKIQVLLSVSTEASNTYPNHRFSFLLCELLEVLPPNQRCHSLHCQLSRWAANVLNRTIHYYTTTLILQIT